jgi:hypothetical protein
MTASRYAVICCTGHALAYFDTDRFGRVTVTTAGETPHLSIASAPVVDGKPLQTPEQMHEMTTAQAAERHVTEIAWATHRSWIIRCGEVGCTQQAEVSNLNLRKLTQRLAEGTWPDVDGIHIIPLRVLNPILNRING